LPQIYGKLGGGGKTYEDKDCVDVFLISNFRRVLYVVYFLLDNSPASEFRRRRITQKKTNNIVLMAERGLSVLEKCCRGRTNRRLENCVYEGVS
jgi:hypothetical protein